MRLNTNMESYKIDSLEDIEKNIIKMRDRAEDLADSGKYIRKRIDSTSDEFTSVNYQRVSDACDDYVKKMTKMEDELTELAESIREFVEKIHRIWL